MIDRHPIQRFAIAFLVVMFLADAINIDEIFGLTSFEREGDLACEFVFTGSPSVAANNLQKPVSFSSNTSNAHKTKLELFDEDSPSLEAGYISRDEIIPMLHEAESFLVPVSPDTKISFHSLCKLQI